MNSTYHPIPLGDETQWSQFNCTKDALSDFFGWFLQGVLAGIAFTFLIAKRFCESRSYRRPWEIWWYDTSKQGIGALVIHMTNVYISPLFQGDPCTWYIINFLLDSTIGLFIVYIGIRVCQYLAKIKRWDSINFGEYGAPKSWSHQTLIYVGLMIIVKLITTLFIQLDFWNNVKNFVLSPFSDQRIEVFVVMFLIPFIVNIIIFWVTDNFLMRHSRKRASPRTREQKKLCQKVKIKFLKKLKENESESENLISGDDDELLGSSSASSVKSQTSLQQRSSVVIMA